MNREKQAFRPNPVFQSGLGGVSGSGMKMGRRRENLLFGTLGNPKAVLAKFF